VEIPARAGWLTTGLAIREETTVRLTDQAPCWPIRWRGGDGRIFRRSSCFMNPYLRSTSPGPLRHPLS